VDADVVAATVGLTIIINFSYALSGVRYLLSYYEFIDKFLSCSMCVGFWVGGILRYLTYFDLASQLVDLKTELTWLNEVNSQSLQMTLRNLDGAYVKFFKGQNEFPKFKSKRRGSQSFQCPQKVKINFENKTLKLPKFKTPIDIIIDRQFKGIVKTVTISKTPTLKYFASILVDTGISIPEKIKIKEKTSIGVDLGINSYIILSDGTKTNNPKYLRKGLERIKHLQLKKSKKIKDSSRHKKLKLKIAKKYEIVTNQRKDFLHKLSDSITKNYDTVCIENLKISNMVKNHNLALSISDASWGMFVEMLKYKSEWRGKNILQIGTFEPSSKTCSCCGNINKELTLSDREWTCVKCNTIHDRDINAAINIKNFALKNKTGVERAKVNVELPTLVGTLKR